MCNGCEQFGKCTLKKYIYDAEDAHLLCQSRLSESRNGRTYKDFLEFMEAHPEYPVVQMDSVCGIKGGKVLLTIHFVDTSFMPAFIRDANTSRSVTEIWDMIYRALGRKDFEKLCPIVLTDNGSEFSLSFYANHFFLLKSFISP